MKLDFSKNPFVIFTLAAIFGIILGKFFLPLFYSVFICFFFVLLLIANYFLFKLENLSQLLIMIILLFAFSVRINAVYHCPDSHIIFLDYQKVKSIEAVVEEVRYKKNGRHKYVLAVKTVQIDSELVNTEGRILLNTYKIKSKYSYGNRLRVKCRLRQPKAQRNPGQFDYQRYLADQDILLVTYINHTDSISVLEKNAGNVFVKNIVAPVKNYAEQTINNYLSAQYESILKALLLGEKQDINVNIIEQFKNVGVVHVLAISGLHVGFIIIFIFTFLTFLRLNYKTKIYGLLILLFIYVAVINFKAPVVRASIMAGLYLIAKLYERKISLFNIIFFAAFFLLLIDPRDLFNPGFQFSFTAVLAIVYGYPKLNGLIPVKNKLKLYNQKWFVNPFIKFLWDPLLVSLTAVLGTLPLTLYYYGIFPTYALIANIIVIPLIGIIVFLGLFMLIFALFSSVIAFNLGHLINLIFDVLINIIAYFQALPYSHFYMTTPSILSIVLFFILIFCVFNWQKRLYRFSVVLIVLIFIFQINLNQKQNKYLEITFLDVGQGDATFIRFPNGENMLVDGGDATKDWDQGKNTILPFLQFNNVEKIKYVVASHPHNDHIGGLIYILNSIAVDTLVLSPYKFNTKTYQQLLNISRLHGVPLKYVKKGNQLFPDSSCRVYVVHPSENFTTSNDYSGTECNNSSLVIKIQYGENSILLTGDAEKQAERVYSRYGEFLKSEILKLGHHGSRTSSSNLLLEYVNPLIGIITVAERNKFRHPSPKTIQSLKQNNIKPKLTSQNGAIQFHVYPKYITYHRWHKNAIKLF